MFDEQHEEPHHQQELDDQFADVMRSCDVAKRSYDCAGTFGLDEKSRLKAAIIALSGRNERLEGLLREVCKGEIEHPNLLLVDLEASMAGQNDRLERIPAMLEELHSRCVAKMDAHPMACLETTKWAYIAEGVRRSLRLLIDESGSWRNW